MTEYMWLSATVEANGGSNKINYKPNYTSFLGRWLHIPAYLILP